MSKLRTIAAATVLSVTAGAAVAEAIHIRGEITAVDGDKVTVETVAGQSVDITLVDPSVLMYRTITLADVPEGAYLSIPSVPAEDGNLTALGVAVFPEAFRGANEGTMAWDLTADSRMTNATLAQLVEQDGENVLTVTFGGDSQTIYVPDDAPISTFSPSPETEISVGQNAVFFAETEGGMATSSTLAMHEDGSLPAL